MEDRNPKSKQTKKKPTEYSEILKETAWESVGKGNPIPNPLPAEEALVSPDKIPPQIIPESYYILRECLTTNQLAEMGAYRQKEIEEIIEYGTADSRSIKVKRGFFAIKTSYKLPNVATFQLLDALTIKMRDKDRLVILPLSEFMEMRGLKNRQEAKRQADIELDVLTSLKYTEKDSGNSSAYINIASSGFIKKNGDIHFRFTEEYFFMLIQRCSHLPCLRLLLRINSRKNPSGYFLLRKLLLHKYMNFDKPNRNTISVKKLLEADYAIPRYEEIMKKDRAVDRRIIEPFTKSLDGLAPDVQWYFCHDKGVRLSEEEAGNLKYSTFINLNIYFEIADYPDQTARLNKLEDIKRLSIAREKGQRKTNKKPKS